jgi:RHS repeat-associated protein
VSRLGSQDVWYKYDALGRRVERDKGVAGPIPLATETTRFVHDGPDVVRDLDGAGSPVADYVNGPGIDNKLRQTVSGTASYFIQDHLGTTRAFADASGNGTSSLSYDSFGNVVSGSVSSRYTYTGRERDPDAGLLYYRARYYDPLLGRFVSEDPTVFGGKDVNLYAYVKNNPINFIDPTGLELEQLRKALQQLPPNAFQPSGPGIFQALFGDGGVFTKPTIEEFFSAKERARRPCKRFGERFWESFSDTNQAIPGVAAPIGTTIITAPGAAQITGQPGLLGWAWRGGGPGFGASVVQSGATSIATQAAFEGGVAVGSYVDAIGCPCGYEGNSGWLWRYFSGSFF